MGTLQLVAMTILALAFAAANLVFWWWVVKHGDALWRARVERRYGVTIAIGSRGHWNITSGPGGKLKHFGIEMLQLAYFMGAFFGWAVAMIVIVVIMDRVQKML